VRRGLARIPVKRWTFVIAEDSTVLEVIKSEVSMHRHADRALEVLRAHAA
jgi:peroxiredoxin Q/BCP